MTYSTKSMCNQDRGVTTYLFDWGNTLMIDFPDAQGKMCDWQDVEAVDCAEDALKALSEKHAIYIATSAKESSEDDIARAFQRVGLDRYISGYFCQHNLGLAKGSVEFYTAIVSRLGINPEQAMMVGDTLEKDILPALKAGLGAIWFNPTERNATPIVANQQIKHLSELIASRAPD